MAANKYIKLASGILTEQAATQTSAGGANANQIAALDSTGHFDSSLMPVGIAPEADTMVTSENLAAGAFVNAYSNAGVVTARNADATNPAKEADGFVLTASTSPATNIVYRLSQTNTQLSSLTAGSRYYLSDSSVGAASLTVPSTAGHIVQELGVAMSTTSLEFKPKSPITLG